MLNNRIDNLIAEATKNKEHIRLEVLRAIKNEFIKYIKSGSDKELNEQAENEILVKMINRSKDSIEQFKQGDRYDLVESESEQLKIIEEFAPKMYSQEEIKERTLLVIAEYLQEKESGYKLSMKDTKEILNRVKEICANADGKLISSIIKENIV